MANKELLPAERGVYLSAANIGGDRVERLRDKLAGRRGGSARPKDVRRILRPAENPRANITMPEELANLHIYMGLEDVEKEHLEDLESFMKSVLGIHFGKKEIVADTIPPRLDEEDGTLVLGVAGSEEIIAARSLAKAAYGAYYRLRDIPDDVWVGPDDELITRVRLAESAGPSTDDLLRHLYVEIHSDATLLEAQTRFTAPQMGPAPDALR